MEEHEILAEARHHLRDVIERQAPLLTANHGLTAEMFTEAVVSQRPVVSFSCKDREDVIEIYLDPQSGALIDLIHIPKQPKRKPR